MEHAIHARLRQAMRAAGLDALVAHSIDNGTYTAGVLIPSHATNRFRRTMSVLAGERFACQIVVTVEENLAREHSRFEDIRTYDQFSDNPADTLADALEEAGVAGGRIGLELDYLPAEDYLRLAGRLPKAAFAPAREIFFAARMVKTPEEVATLGEIGRITETAMAEVMPTLRPGMSEQAVYRDVLGAILEGGADDVVKIQVGSGPRSGIINCKPSARTIEPGDVLRLEVLGQKRSYTSNVTRTAVFGRATDEQKRIWRTLIEARDRCQGMLRPGTPVAELWRAYAGTCRDGGVEPSLRFLGHGIGLTVHEEPYITESRDALLQPNMTHTMEPLYMLPGRMGFHVEDMYLITEQGFEPVTGTLYPNDELIELG